MNRLVKANTAISRTSDCWPRALATADCVKFATCSERVGRSRTSWAKLRETQMDCLGSMRSSNSMQGSPRSSFHVRQPGRLKAFRTAAEGRLA